MKILLAVPSGTVKTYWTTHEISIVQSHDEQGKSVVALEADGLVDLVDLVRWIDANRETLLQMGGVNDCNQGSCCKSKCKKKGY